MRKTVLITLLSVILIPLASLQAQKYYVVKGQIYDVNDKMTLPQAQVAVVGASGLGAVADIDGNYTLAVDRPEFELNFRYLGYQDKKVKVQFSKGEEVKVLNVGLDTRAQEMQEVKIRGSRVERDGKNSVQSIEMVSIDQIAKNNVTTLDKALKNVAGLAIVDNEPQMRGGSGFSSGMGSRVMLLLDNMPMLRADAGRPTWNLISMDDVEQIDVLKGAASVLYGSAAINGAINVHTKFASAEPVSSFKLYWGAYAKPNSVSTITHKYDKYGGAIPPDFDVRYSTQEVRDESWNYGLPMKYGMSITHSRRMAKWWDFSANLDYAYDFGYRLNGSQSTDENFRYKLMSDPDVKYSQEYLRDEKPNDYEYWQYKNNYEKYKEEYEDAKQRYETARNRVQPAEQRVRAGLSNQFHINDNWTLALNGNFLYSHNFMYNFWANAFDGKYRPFGNVDNSNGKWATTLSEFSDIVFLIDPHLKYVSPKGGVHELDNRYMFSNNNVLNITGQDAASQSVYNTYRYRKTFAKAADLALTAGFTNSYAYSSGEVFSGNTSAIGTKGVHTADNLALFFKLEKPFLKEQNLRLELGGRYEFCFVDDWHESAPVFQLGLNYEIPQSGSIFRFSVGQGYRAATIGEKFITTRVGMYGFYPNPDLKSEKSLNFDLGYRQMFKFGKVMQGFLDVSGFHQYYWNYIEFFMGPWNPDSRADISEKYGFEFFNTGLATISGVEASLMTEFDIVRNFQINLSANYTYSLPVCRDTGRVYRQTQSERYTYNSSSSNTEGNILKYRIQHMAKLDVDFRFWKIWSVGVGVQYMSAMKNVDRVFVQLDGNEKGHATWLDGLDMDLPFYGISEFMRKHDWGSIVLDLRMSVDINRFTVSVVVNNALNAEYSLRPLYIEAPLNFNVQVVYRFQDINPVTWFKRKPADVAKL